MDKCQFCGKPAIVHMTQIVNNQTTVVKMCGECAAKKGLFDKEGLPFAMLSNLGEALFSGIKQTTSTSSLICSKCGCTPMSFKETGRLGCSDCYKDLKLLVEGIIESSQKGTVHKGKILKSSFEGPIKKSTKPSRSKQAANETSNKKKPAKEDKLAELQKTLAKAVEMEKYEEAAKLRDEIQTLKKSKN